MLQNIMMNRWSTTTATLLGLLLAIETSSISAFSCAKLHHRTSCASKLAARRHASDQQEPADPQRRKTVQNGIVGSLLPFFAKHPANAATTTTTVAVESSNTPIADFPMRKLRLPKGGLGREYIILQLYIDGNGPYDFMVDSGLTTELITPHLQTILNAKSSGITKQGLSAGNAGSEQSLVELNNVELCCGGFASGEAMFKLDGPLHAIVTDFPQEHMDPSHDPVVSLLSLYSVDEHLLHRRLLTFSFHLIDAGGDVRNGGVGTI